jgi:hypothetical protein
VSVAASPGFAASQSPGDEEAMVDDETIEVVVNAQSERRGMPVIVLRDSMRRGRREAVLTDDWLYNYPVDGRVFLVPAGYTTDFASIPTAARFIADQYGKHAEASVIHDWLYATGNPDPAVKKRGRKEADEILLYAMREKEVPWLTRSIIYRMVRLFGDRSYGTGSEWNDHWTSFEPENTGQSTLPRVSKVTVTHIAVMSRDDFEVYRNVERLKFLKGTRVDTCSRLYSESERYGGQVVAEALYASCFSDKRYESFLHDVKTPEDCTNMENLACAEELWRPESLERLTSALPVKSFLEN